MNLWSLLRPLAFRLPPETAHDVAVVGMEVIQHSRFLRASLGSCMTVVDPRLRQRVFGLHFPGVVGLAAGFDKDARLLPSWDALGFGFVEVGTVTPQPQAGNPRPRLFRLPRDGAVINRMGFNNAGAAAVRARLLRFRKSGAWPAIPVGVNLGKNKATPLEKAPDDYVALFNAFHDLADYLVVNVSSPNTPGLRELQEKGRLGEILAAIQARNHGRKPILMKVAPDLEWARLDDVLALCQEHHLAGIIATNTTISREGIRTTTAETGGLSGRPLRERATAFIRHIFRATGGRLPILGAGGIFTADDAWEKILAGASLTQIYTGFIYQGPTIARDIHRGLLKRMDREGIRHVSEVVGKGS